MKYALYVAAMTFMALVPWSRAAQKGFEDGVITRVEKKSHDRILYYLVNTPVMTEDPYYEISVRVNDKVYVGEYPLRESDVELPFDWKAGDAVRVLTDKAHILIQRPAGGSLKMIVTRHFAVPTPTAVSIH